MKKVYICANYFGLEENYFKFLNYCEYVVSKGLVPLSTVTMYHKALDENIPEQQKIISVAAKALIDICDEVWVFGKCRESLISDVAESGKPIIYVRDRLAVNSASEKLGVIMREFEADTGRTVNRTIMESALYYLNEGITSGLIIEAIKKTAKINAGWNYTEGILRSCLSQGITTAEAFTRRGAPKQDNSMAAYDLDLYEQMLNKKD